MLCVLVLKSLGTMTYVNGSVEKREGYARGRIQAYSWYGRSQSSCRLCERGTGLGGRANWLQHSTSHDARRVEPLAVAVLSASRC